MVAVAGCNGLLWFTTATNQLDTILLTMPALAVYGKYRDYILGQLGYGYYIYKMDALKQCRLIKMNTRCIAIVLWKMQKAIAGISTNRGLFKARLDDIITNFWNRHHSYLLSLLW